MLSSNIKNKLNGCCYIIASRSSIVKSIDSFLTCYKNTNIIGQKLLNNKSRTDLNIPSSPITEFHWEHHVI